MGALSGGQKVKVVLGAGLWNLPLVILDEPTNFLDRDSLGALATAIKEFKGGVFMISHNAEFYEALCPEKWILESSRLTVMGAEWMEEVKARKRAEACQEDVELEYRGGAEGCSGQHHRQGQGWGPR